MKATEDVEARVVALIKTPRRDRLGRIGSERDPHVLGQFALRSRGVERMEALVTLGEMGSPEAEPYLIEVIRGEPDPFATPMANASLGKVGSTRAIPYLTRFIHHPVEDVKQSAIAALSALGDASLTPVYLDALSDRSWGAKWYAMKAIHQRGDERAIGPVAERVKIILAKKPKTNIGGWSELMYALDFLRKWSERSSEARAMLAWAAGRQRFFRDPELAWYENTFGTQGESRPTDGRNPFGDPHLSDI